MCAPLSQHYVLIVGAYLKGADQCKVGPSNGFRLIGIALLDRCFVCRDLEIPFQGEKSKPQIFKILLGFGENP